MKKAKLFMMLALLVMGVSNVFAQNVTIRGNNGSMIASVPEGSSDYDTFFKCGGFASWEHEQLAMVLTASDETTLTTNGQLDNPANNLFSDANNHMQIGKGYKNYPTCYVSVTLPKGYRFTGYTIKFSKIQETKKLNNNSVEFNNDVAETRFGETNRTFNTYVTSATVTRGGGSQIIQRGEGTGGTMSNVLYFKLENTSNNTSNRALITLESAEFTFTAEENYVPVLPTTDVSGVSAVDIEFPTSKVDFGPIQSRNYDGVNRVSYSSSNVHDLIGKLTLYEAESVKSGSDIDGITGNVVNYVTSNHTISHTTADGNFFRLGKEGAEQVYYIETPTSVELSNGTKNPVGYRIVAADIVYKTPGASTKYYITYTSGNTTYYLGANGQFSTTKTEWETDNNGRIHSGNTYLGYTTQLGFSGRTFTFNTYNGAPTNPLYVDSSNRIYGSYRGTFNTYTFYLYHNGNNAALSESTSNLATWTSETESASSSFTLYVYDKEGKNPVQYTNGTGTVHLTGLNNDAVKIGVKGIGLVNFTLTMQALDPYLQSMDVVCTDRANSNIRLWQNFTASDFEVNGGEFYFFVPEETENVDITFENLYSKYFDDTYEGGKATCNSRISFVKSAHYNVFGNVHPNNLYTNANTIAEAASGTPQERQKVGIVGTQPFRFNNAAQVGTSGGTLTEYPFSLEKYADAPNNGSFSSLGFAVTSEDQVETRYVFTTDETRYNIAPTTATQHRAYAFYKMIIHVQSHEYDPKVEFTKIYDKTCYQYNKEKQDDAFYGVKVTADYNDHGTTKKGYASTKSIFEKIEKILNNTHVDDGGNNDLPESSSQILYLDFSGLKGIYQVTTDQHGSMEDFSATNAKNCLIFLPEGASAPNNNVAYQMKSGVFQSAHDIVLTDKQPFYSPYDITVLTPNKISYTREVTIDKYGKVQNASLILPFAVTLYDGEHINSDETSFTLHNMQATAALEKIDGNTYGYFPAESDALTVSEANKPYLVQLTENSSKDNVSFIVDQVGGKIEATKGLLDSKYNIAGSTSTGTASEGDAAGTYTFYNKGTYAGIEVPRTPAVFYFAKNEFVSSANLSGDYETAKIAPFRAYYATSSTGNAKLMNFRIIFDENHNTGTTEINDIKRNSDLAVIPSNGSITIVSKVVQDVSIHSVNGQIIDKCSLKAGDTHTVTVPAGVYVINGVKMIVK